MTNHKSGIVKNHPTSVKSSFAVNYLFQSQKEDVAMWLSTSDSSAMGSEEVAARLRVEIRQGLSWQEATHRRQLSG